MKHVVTTHSADESRDFGHRLAGVLRAGDLVIVTGELGAGKTTLVQGIGAGLGVRGTIASPTFVIARSHPPRGQGPGLVHVDAYRLGSLDELDHLDLDTELEDNVTVVEWGQGFVEGLAADRLEISVERARGGFTTAAPAPPGADLRRIAVTAIGPRWSEILLPGRGES